MKREAAEMNRLLDEQLAADPVGPRVIPIRGIGGSAIVLCETAEGKVPLAFLVDREHLTDAQWLEVLADAETWTRRLSGLRVGLRIV